MASAANTTPTCRSLALGSSQSIIRDHVLRPYEKASFHATEQWRSLPETPTSEEIMGTHDYLPNTEVDDEDEEAHIPLQISQLPGQIRPGLPTNIIDGLWKDSASYIGAHYQLLREDAIFPLRKAVADVKADPTMKDNGTLAIYTHVHIIGITLSTQGPALKVEFSYENAGKRIRWEQSNRLQQGTIVALTPRFDMFRTVCKIAVVAARPIKDGLELNPPRLDLFWADWNEAEIDPSQNWVMVEARSGYWESFRHMGVALQKLRSESFPHARYLVNLQKTINSPRHIEFNPCTQMSSLLSTPDHMDEFENVNITKPWPQMPSNLDESQLEATKRILTKQVAIIQGPPGTGKTFVSLTSLKIMLDNWAPGDPPIIIAAQTNHALDQLLLLIEPHAPDFIRLGGRTSDGTGVIKKRTIFEVRRAMPSGERGYFHNLDIVQGTMLRCLGLLVNNESLTASLLLDFKLITQEQHDSLQPPPGWVDTCASRDLRTHTDVCKWVGEYMCHVESKCPPINASFEEEELEDQYEKLNEEEAELGGKSKEDENIDNLKGEFFTLKQSWTGQRSRTCSERKIAKLLQLTSNLWDIQEDLRGNVYCYLQDQVKKWVRQTFRNECNAYMRSVAHKKISKWQSDNKMITEKKVKIIGATTTGLSKYRGLIASLKPRTLLIEEAAETVEGTILAAMFESLDHLILVGDHQQLQAKCNLGKLSHSPYNLAISLFERLVKNGLEYTMLNTQRRMIPPIRKTFTHVYPHLNDHDSVLDRLVNRPRVPGMARDIFWYHHLFPESRMDTSRCNIDEAEQVVRFFDFLVLNNVDPSKITILTFYNGQKKVLLRMLKNHLNLKEITYFNVFTVDSYQGEENDVILLSLVRSNNDQQCGFLANRNRVVVSLSRARRGLYLFGNILNLVSRPGESSNVWGPVVDAFRLENNSFSEKLPLTCENHRQTVFVQEPSDWDAHGIIGGCRIKCKGVLPCGHDCPLNCHPFDHDRLMCKEPCLKPLECGHSCNQNCGDNCYCMECIVAEEEQEEISDAGTQGWVARPDFLRSLKQTLVSTPLTHQSVFDNSQHPSLPDRQLVQERPAQSYTPAQWQTSANAPKTLARFQPARPTDQSSEVGVRTITDIFRQVIVTDEGRSALRRPVTREFFGTNLPAPTPATIQELETVGSAGHAISSFTSPSSPQSGPETLSSTSSNQGASSSRVSSPLSLMDDLQGHGMGGLGGFDTMCPLIEEPQSPLFNVRSPLRTELEPEVTMDKEEDLLISFD